METSQTRSVPSLSDMKTFEGEAHIRDLTPGDVPALVRLPESGGDCASEWRRRLRRSRTVVSIGAEAEGRLVGYAAGEVRAAFGLTAVGWIEAFNVDPRWRGHGVGRALASSLLWRLREMGATHVHTLLPLHDFTLAPLLHDLGFREDPLVCLGRSV